MNANVRDRHSIMAIYALERFEMDADQNSMAAETTRHGLPIGAHQIAMDHSAWHV